MQIHDDNLRAAGLEDLSLKYLVDVCFSLDGSSCQRTKLMHY